MANISFNSFSIILLLAGIATAFMSVFVYRRIGGPIKWFSAMMMTISLWGFAYGCELLSTTLPQIIFWVKIEYLGIATLPTLWVIFILSFTGKEKWINQRNLILLFIEPILTIIFVWTNDLHHLHYQSISLDSSGPFPLLSIVRGPWYIIHTLYFYVFNAWGLFFLLNKFKSADPIFKRQNSFIIYATVIPWLVNVVYFFEVRPFKHIDLTPFAFLIFSAIIGLGLIRFKLFNILPIAREKIIEALKEGVLVLDTYNRVIDINPEMKIILSNYSNQFVGNSIMNIFPIPELLKSSIENRNNNTIEIKLKVQKSYRIFEVSITTLFEKQTIYSGLILLFKDTTEKNIANNKLKDQAEQLQVLNQLKDRLFSIISHDLRTPLNSLKETVYLIEQDSLTDFEFQTIIPELSKNIEYTSELLENLLHWSKSQLKGEMIIPTLFDFEELIASKLSFFEQKAQLKGILIKHNVLKGTMVFADKNMMEIVFRNIISNAIKFCSKNDVIQLEANKHQNRTTIIITDTGIGIPQPNLERILNLEIFTTMGSSKEQGTGLGLILCDEFVKKNDGLLTIESAVGVGTKLSIDLPNIAH